MSTRARWNFSRLPLLALIVAVSFALPACGGGGGGGGGGTGGNTGGGGNNGGGGGGTITQGESAVSGKVVDQNGNGVSGATIEIVGTSATATSGSDGTFTTVGFAAKATAFTVVVPSTYSALVSYNSLLYNVTPSRNGGPCGIPLPTLATGQATALPESVQIFSTAVGSGSGVPPPPPIYGCQ